MKLWSWHKLKEMSKQWKYICKVESVLAIDSISPASFHLYDDKAKWQFCIKSKQREKEFRRWIEWKLNTCFVFSFQVSPGEWLTSSPPIWALQVLVMRINQISVYYSHFYFVSKFFNAPELSPLLHHKPKDRDSYISFETSSTQQVLQI